MPELTINMSEAEWAAVANALNDRFLQLPKESPGDWKHIEKLTRDLREGFSKITAALKVAGIPW